MDECPLLERVVHDGPHASEDRAKDGEPHGRVAFGSRHRDGAPGHCTDAVVGRVGTVAEEDGVVVGPGVRVDVLDEGWAVRARRLKPGQFIGDRVRPVEDLELPAIELIGIAFAQHRKPSDGQVVDAIGARGEPVLPGHRIVRARRQNLHVCMTS